MSCGCAPSSSRLRGRPAASATLQNAVESRPRPRVSQDGKGGEDEGDRPLSASARMVPTPPSCCAQGLDLLKPQPQAPHACPAVEEKTALSGCSKKASGVEPVSASNFCFSRTGPSYFVPASQWLWETGQAFHPMWNKGRKLPVGWPGERPGIAVGGPEEVVGAPSSAAESSGLPWRLT